MFGQRFEYGRVDVYRIAPAGLRGGLHIGQRAVITAAAGRAEVAVGSGGRRHAKSSDEQWVAFYGSAVQAAN